MAGHRHPRRVPGEIERGRSARGEAGDGLGADRHARLRQDDVEAPRDILPAHVLDRGDDVDGIALRHRRGRGHAGQGEIEHLGIHGDRRRALIVGGVGVRERLGRRQGVAAGRGSRGVPAEAQRRGGADGEAGDRLRADGHAGCRVGEHDAEAGADVLLADVLNGDPDQYRQAFGNSSTHFVTGCPAKLPPVTSTW